MKTETISSIIMLVGLIFLFIFYVLMYNSCSSSSWNNGVCPNCGVEYELKAVDHGLEYWMCPECGKDVERY